MPSGVTTTLERQSVYRNKGDFVPLLVTSRILLLAFRHRLLAVENLHGYTGRNYVSRQHITKTNKKTANPPSKYTRRCAPRFSGFARITPDSAFGFLAYCYI